MGSGPRRHGSESRDGGKCAFLQLTSLVTDWAMKEPVQPANDAAPPLGPPVIDDPEILALLDFEPVPRRFKKEDGWTPQMQRLFIARLAAHGSPGKACNELGKYRSGIDKVFHSAGAESFRDAWAAAVELADRRRAEQAAAGHASTADLKMPSVDNRRKTPAGQADANGQQPLPGQLLNEHGEWEDEASYLARVEEAKESICMKLLRCRRLGS